MAKRTTITTVQPHYIGQKSLSEAFSTILKRQIQQAILQHENEMCHTLLNEPSDCDKIETSNLLSESEEI